MNLTAEIVTHYREKGFAVIRNVIDVQLLTEADQHVKWLIDRYPELRPEHFHHPLMRDDAFWVRLVTDESLLAIAEQILGPDLACFTAHYICKPPYDGHPVFWHQDGAYWKLEPMDALTVWLAIDETSTENGCLRVIPSSHLAPLEAPVLRVDTPNMLYSSMQEQFVNKWIEREGIFDITLQPGDVSIHHPHIIHSSGPNLSEKRRCGLDIGYMAATTRISNKDLYLDPILVRGRSHAGINSYRKWPRFIAEETIPFRGHEVWNTAVARLEFAETAKKGEESPIKLALHMIDRLKAGTVKH